MLPLPLLLLLIALGLAMIWFSRFQKSGKSSLPWAGWRCCYSACNRSPTVCYARLKTPTRRGREIRRWAISWCWAAGMHGIELGAQLEPDQQQPAAPERGDPPVAGQSWIEDDLHGRCGKTNRSVPLKQEQEWLNHLAYRVPPSSRWIAQRYRRRGGGGETGHR